MTSPRKRRFSGNLGESNPSPDLLPIFRPNYQYSIRQPILVPANDDEMIAVMTTPSTGRLYLSSSSLDCGEEVIRTWVSVVRWLSFLEGTGRTSGILRQTLISCTV
jgi:hypothetical protein